MSISAKFLTASRLMLKGNWRTFWNRISTYRRTHQLRSHGGNLFRYHSFGFPAFCHPDWPDSAQQFVEQVGDRAEISLMRAWLRDGDLVVDAGANMGLFTFGLATAAKTRVLAIDADAFTVEKLAAVVAKFGLGNVIPIHAAVADREGTTTFYTHQDHAMTGYQSLRPPDGATGSDMVAVTVPMTTLVGTCARHADGRIPDMVKIDIEGAEVAALAATPPSWFIADGPFWLIEIHPEALARFGFGRNDILRYFPSQNFERWLVPKFPPDPATSLAPRPLRETEAFADAPFHNLVAIPRGSGRAGRRASISLGSG